MKLITLGKFNRGINGLWDKIKLYFTTKTYVDEHILWQNGSGEHSIQTKDTNCRAIGDYSVAEGRGSVAMGIDSHAEGNETKTFENAAFAHTEGMKTNAYGEASHAEGGGSVAHNDYAHAEGGGTTALGFSSHTEGNSTIANNPYEHAEGFYNESHYAGFGKTPYPYPDKRNTIHSIGIGTGLQNHKNAVEVMQNGDLYIVGIGGYDGKNFEQTQTVQEVTDSKQDKITAGVNVILTDNNIIDTVHQYIIVKTIVDPLK